MPNPKPFLTLSAVSSRRDSERLGGAVEHTQTPEKCASLLSTKNQNGLRNQFHLSPYKPPTAQCESAHPLSKTNHTPKRNSQTTQANSPNALSQAADASCSWLSRVARQKGVLTAQNFVSRPLPRLSQDAPKTPETPPIPTPKTPKKHPCQHTPRYLYYLTHQPNYQRKPHSEGRRHTPPVTRDSGLNRHGSLPLPGGDCISLPSER